ncbi:hypothetical protein ASG85_03560 [Paenibacillus sp. Soil724D2]|nr:hypothetical protein ASG85_03560 [Paenibacillus sp. Soil724D2]
MEAISSYGIRLAESYVQGIDASRWEQFLKDPKENELYWNIRQELDQYRTQSICCRYSEYCKSFIRRNAEHSQADTGST